MTFAAGDLCLLLDKRERRYMIKLVAGRTFHSHHGTLAHDDVIGLTEGSLVAAASGNRFLALRPTWADYILKMPRGAAVVYPKDVGSILVEADIAPGMSVLEAGTGSGSLTLALLRAVGAKGTVHTLEIRSDFHETALSNVDRFASDDPTLGTLDARIADVYNDVLELTVDRAVLDLTEPWLAMDNIERCLRPGGILCVYMPTITQVQRFHERLGPGWGQLSTFETMRRTWKVEGLSVRPDHRMVAHTAFIVVARRMAR